MKSGLRWLNMRDGACPKCGGLLNKDKHPTSPYLKCGDCRFMISVKRCAEILKGMSERKKWSRSFNDEVEENQSRLNNL